MQSVKEAINIAKGLIRNKNYREAEGILLEAVRINPSNVLVLSNLADLYIKTERLDEAWENVESILQSEPGNSYALQKKGDILAKSDRFDEALDIFLDLFKRNKGDFFLIKRISKVYYLMNNHQKALEYVNIGIEKFRDKADLFFLLYQIYKKLDDLKSAKEAIDKALQLDPKNKFYYSQKLSLRLEEMNLDSSNIVEIVEVSEEDNPHLLKLLADRFKKEKEFDKAIDVYKKLISIDDNEFNKKGLAFLYYKIKEYSNAFRIFIGLSDSNFRGNIFLSTIIASAKEIEEKKELLERMVQLAEGSSQFKSLWGRIKKLGKEIEDEENT